MTKLTVKECRILLEQQGWKFLKIKSVIVFSTPNGKKTRMYKLTHHSRGTFLASTRKLKLFVAEQIELRNKHILGVQYEQYTK